MPPIDPRLIPMQQGQPQTLASPPPYYSGPGASGLPSATLPTGQRASDPYAGPRYDLSAEANARAAAKSPAEVSTGQSNAEIAKLKLREERMKQGLDPETGKPATANLNGAVGEQAISDLSEGEKDIVKGITQGRVPVTSLGMARNPTLFKLVQRAFAYEPGTDLTTFARRQAAFQKFMSNPNSPMVRVNQALQHLDRFYINAHNLDNYHSGFFSSFANYPRAAIMAASKDPKFEAFATDRDALASELAAAFQGTGQSALADREEWKKRLSAANSPESFDAAIQEAVQLLAGRVEASNAQFKQAVGANAEFYDLMSPKARDVFDKFNNPDFGQPASEGGKKEISTEKKVVNFPKGFQDEHKTYIDAHRGSLNTTDYLNFRKQLDEKYGTPEGEHPLDEVKDYLDKINQGAKTTTVPFGEKELSDKGLFGTGAFSEKNIATAMSSPEATFLLNATNAGTGGLVDLAAGQEGRNAKEALNEENWKSGLAGEIGGSVVGMGGIARGAGGLATRLGVAEKKLQAALGGANRLRLVKDVGVNAAYGTTRGFTGADEGEGGEGLLKGAAGGALGSVAGNAVTRGIARPFLKDKTLNALNELQGIKMSTLQRFGLGRAEEALGTVPGAAGARRAALASYNINDANRTLAHIGQTVPRGVEPGTELQALVNARINEAYAKIRPRIFGATDGQFDNALTALQAKANTPQKKAWFGEVKEAVDQFKDPVTGLYNGDGYQAASTRLRSLIKEFSNSDEIGSDDMARIAEQTRKQMQFQIQRTAPEVASDLKGVERAYALSMRSEDAARRAKNAGEGFVYAPSQKMTSIEKLDTSANKGAIARGKGLDQAHAEAAARILGQGNVPKLSTKEIAIVSGMLGGTTFAGATTGPTLPIIISGIAYGLYGPGAKGIVQKALTGRPVSLEEKTLLNEAVTRATSDLTRHSITGD